ncbi:hypothetical protein ACXAAV_13515 [Vibrio coralliilyticus]
MSNKKNNLSRTVPGESGKIKNHVLKTKCDCPLTGHHLISHSLFDNLDSERINQMNKKEYSCNDLENIVILPSSDKSIAKKVACKYYIPWHSSGHTGKGTINGLPINKDEDTFSGELKSQNSNNNMFQKRADIFKSDSKKLGQIKPKGYHRYVADLFLDVLKELHCETKPKDYRKALNDLSQTICDQISGFKLLLHNTGEDFSIDGEGCQSQECGIGREHESRNWPTQDIIHRKILYKVEGGVNYLKVAKDL